MGRVHEGARGRKDKRQSAFAEATVDEESKKTKIISIFAILFQARMAGASSFF